MAVLLRSDVAMRAQRLPLQLLPSASAVCE
jgi:hypothetical protein